VLGKILLALGGPLELQVRRLVQRRVDLHVGAGTRAGIAAAGGSGRRRKPLVCLRLSAVCVLLGWQRPSHFDVPTDLRRLHADDVPAWVRIEDGGAVMPRRRCGPPAALLARDAPAPASATGHHIPIDGSARNASRVPISYPKPFVHNILHTNPSTPGFPSLNRLAVRNNIAFRFGFQIGSKGNRSGVCKSPPMHEKTTSNLACLGCFLTCSSASVNKANDRQLARRFDL